MKRPLKFKLDAYRHYLNGHSPIESFLLSGKENACSLSKCMTTKAYASSYMSDDVKNVLKRKYISGDAEVIQYFNMHSISI